MSELFSRHRRFVERLSSHNNLRIDNVSWPGDGHECPSYIQSLRKSFILEIAGVAFQIIGLPLNDSINSPPAPYGSRCWIIGTDSS